MSVTKFKIYLADQPDMYLTSVAGGSGEVEFADLVTPTSDDQVWNVDDLTSSHIAISNLQGDYLYQDGDNARVQNSPNPIPWLKQVVGGDEVEIINDEDSQNLFYLCEGEEGGPDEKKAKVKPKDPPKRKFIIIINQ